MTVADEIRALRASLGENTATFGKRWLKTGRAVEDWEQGRRVPDPFVLAAIRALAARRTKARRAK
jgi:DNA-binding transcriptional regulator YiaG